MTAKTRDTELRTLFEIIKHEKLPRCVIENDSVQSIIVDLDVTTSYIVGIAHKILNHFQIDEQDIQLLHTPVLRDKNLQGGLQDATGVFPEYDLTDLPEILEQSRNVERLRILCIEKLENSEIRGVQIG